MYSITSWSDVEQKHPTNLLMRGRAARLARQAHNLEVVGSNPTPASIFSLSELGKAKIPITA